MKLNQKKPVAGVVCGSYCNVALAIFNVLAILYMVFRSQGSSSTQVVPHSNDAHHLKLTRDSIKEAIHTILHNNNDNINSNNNNLQQPLIASSIQNQNSPFYQLGQQTSNPDGSVSSENANEDKSTPATNNQIPQDENQNAQASKERLEDLACNDPLWCNVPMPSASHYKFKPPMDPVKWRKAQIAAASGEQVLLKRIEKTFTNVYDFLDGDRVFRSLHTIVDIFADSKTGIEALKPNFFNGKQEEERRRRSLSEARSRYLLGEKNEGFKEKEKDFHFDEEEKEGEAVLEERRSLLGGPNRGRPALTDEEPDEDLEYSATVYTSAPVTDRPLPVSHLFGKKNQDEMNIESNRYVVPPHYNYRIKLRSPIVQIGYMAFDKNLNTFFSGNHHGGSFMKRNEFMTKWKAAKDDIDVPFITVCALNENWGPISTNFPNRTAGWGNCCQKSQDKVVYEFLDHPKTLMMVINQHSNLSHPKILTIPRGLPLTWMWTRQVAFDSIRYAVAEIKKEKLLFASASSWGKRPQMIHCISQKFDPNDFEGHDATPKKEMLKTKLDRRRYYHKLASAKFGLSLPGLGYDTFRMWELLTLGSIVVIERGVGFDRTLWRLPALLVDDFDDVTPELLHSAYVEALYRADDFEFNRLKQSFWWDVIYNVSVSMSIDPLMHFFPMEAEDTGFTRPKDPYECGRYNPHRCGVGTKRTPKSSC